MTPVSLIEQKRDGREHSPTEIHALIEMFMAGQMRDYQMSAWLMACTLRGLSDREMVALTEAMLHSGSILHLPGLGAPKIDKHSTGGVGDKLSLALAPLVAGLGLCVPMIAGRGLGHTGGTLDKLESIPGYDVRLSNQRLSTVLKKVGVSINGQTDDIAPADRRIYALRDVTGTVACRPLIVASILSKKLAAGLDGLVLDVKVGRGAFMKTLSEAKALARSLTSVSARLGTPAVALLTRMEEPLGRTIGNALEVKEAVEILQGTGPLDVTELTLRLGEEMLLLGGLARTRPEARRALEEELSSGRAWERLAKMVALHGGDARVIEDPRRLPRAPKRSLVLAPRSGTVTAIDSLALAEVALDLGAGRRHAEDPVDPAVGIELLVGVGERVTQGEPLARLHARRVNPALTTRTASAWTIRRRKPAELVGAPLVLGRVAAR